MNDLHEMGTEGIDKILQIEQDYYQKEEDGKSVFALTMDKQMLYILNFIDS